MPHKAKKLKQSFDQEMDELTKHVSAFLENFTSNAAQAINEKDCEEKRKILRQSIQTNPHSFFVEINLIKKAVTWSVNVSSFLPYSDVGGPNEITFLNLFEIIHPQFLRLYIEFGSAAYKTYTYTTQKDPSDTNYFYYLNFPIKRTNQFPKSEAYWWVQQVSNICLVDEDLNMISHINEYRFIEKFEDQKIRRPLVSFRKQNNINQERGDLSEYLISKISVSEVLTNIFGFTQREVEILYWASKGYSSPKIVHKLEVKLHTVNKHKSNLLQKAKGIFPKQFQTAEEVANYIIQLFGKIEVPNFI